MCIYKKRKISSNDPNLLLYNAGKRIESQSKEIVITGSEVNEIENRKNTIENKKLAFWKDKQNWQPLTSLTKRKRQDWTNYNQEWKYGYYHHF